MQQPRIIDDRFILKESIGNGRMSSVYLALDSASDDAEVAVKILNTSHPDKIKHELFKRETSALKRLQHPNIVELRHSGWSESEGAFFLVLDYLPYSLEKYLNGEPNSCNGNFRPYRVIRELAEAVVYAHSEGVIHRDIKPSNVLFDYEGRPKLTDFGISKLVTHLTIGETLAGYWSAGYASPEQRAGQVASMSSDIYSLGATFCHLLTGHQPPPEGPDPAMVDQYLDGPRPLVNTLKGMLAVDCNERPTSGANLLSALETTRKSEVLPGHFLILTAAAMRSIVSSGYASNEDFHLVANVVVEDLGGIEVDDVHVNSDKTRDRNDVIILGAELRYVCVSDPEYGDALIVKTVHCPHMPNLDAERSRSMPYRAMWTPVARGFRNDEDESSLKTATTDLTNLLAELNTFSTKGAVKEERRSSRRDFIEHWIKVLKEQRNRIEEGATKLEYSKVEENPTTLAFTLNQSPPDSLDWKDDTPLAVKESIKSRLIPVGNLVEIRGRTVETARQSDHSGTDNTDIPSNGSLMINAIEALTANSRQRFAANAFLNEQMANPKLTHVITNPANATRTLEPDLKYFQDWLSEDKKLAVRKVISSNELFLIQGPPGTGKTTVIAEIVLQILKKNPDVRILLASQSNVAVDHALTQIGKASQESGLPTPEMVRIGRDEKIGSGGTIWTLSERARAWRREVIAKCDPVIDELRQQERGIRKSMRVADKQHVTESTDAETIEEWISEANCLIEQLREYEQEYDALGPDVHTEIKNEIVYVVQQTRSQLTELLETLNDLVPNPVDLKTIESEADVLSAIIKSMRSSDISESDDLVHRNLLRTQELRKLLTHWKNVVGLKADFQDLISRSARIVAATCLYSANLFRSNTNGDGHESRYAFDWAIIDEAGRATVPEVLIPIVRSKQVVLVGDERQLPPMVDDKIARTVDVASDNHKLDTSLFQSLIEQLEGTTYDSSTSLRTQYRMQPAIGNLVSNVFYGGELVNGKRTGSRKRGFDWMPASVTWLSTSRMQRRSENRSGQSYINRIEVDVVLTLLKKMETECRKHKQTPSVGIITGYAAQVEHLSARIEPSDRDRWQYLEVEIATVDSFQGRECDIVVYSTVRSNDQQKIGFLRDYRRVNVALSRARDLLVIVGDVSMMKNATIDSNSNPFSAVIRHMNSQPEDDCRIVSAELVKLYER